MRHPALKHSQQHPDKGGDATVFASIQRAYDVLSDAAKRERYDADGSIERSAGGELLGQRSARPRLGQQRPATSSRSRASRRRS